MSTANRLVYGVYLSFAIVTFILVAPLFCQACAGTQHTGDWALLHIDPVLFALKQWAPDWLAGMQEPSAWPFPLNHVVASDVWQILTHRWDRVDIHSSSDLYRAHMKAWSCMTATSGVLIVALAVVPLP